MPVELLSFDVRDYPQLYGPIFRAVQLGGVFPDSKTFVDSLLNGNPQDILSAFERERSRGGFDLGRFVQEHFLLPDTGSPPSVISPSLPIEGYIEEMWSVLTRPADTYNPRSTLIALPNSYVIAGDRFREMYYWDTFFTSLGLMQSGRVDMVINMCDNFAYLIDTLGFVPNGSRVYYTTRSQPPVFALMVNLLEQNGYPVDKYLPQLEKEHEFFAKGSENLHREGNAEKGVVMSRNGIILARNYDDADRPREESYREDYTDAKKIHPVGRARFLRDIRAAAASGWDFSSRWFRDLMSILTIHTTDIIPVDLNSLLFLQESQLSRLHQKAGNTEKSKYFFSLADNRRFAIQDIFWSSENRFFHDFDFTAGKRNNGKLTDCWSLAAVLPLFAGAATGDQAYHVARQLETRFLKEGGLAATLHKTGQQWDSPNGWAPLHLFAVSGLRRYGFDKLADQVAERWLRNCRINYEWSRGMFEKYDVLDPTKRARGGEYPVQMGFGWTNGVYLVLGGRKIFIPTTV